MSQEALAERLSLTRSKLSALENGQTRAPQPEDLVACSEFFGISIDSLLKIDLTTLGELKLRELEAASLALERDEDNSSAAGDDWLLDDVTYH